MFLDKDGTLVENVAYNADPDKVRLLPYAAEALKRLQDEGFLLIVVSNQSGIALGYFTESDLKLIRETISGMLEDENVFLHDFYYCPHLAGARIRDYAKECECRKPRPGLLLKAAKENDIDLSRSWMIGDILDDVEAGRHAGCRTILLDNGNETEWVLEPERSPHFMVDDWKEAAAIILKFSQ